MKTDVACSLVVYLIAGVVICHQGQHHGPLKSSQHASMHGSKMSQEIE